MSGAQLHTYAQTHFKLLVLSIILVLSTSGKTVVLVRGPVTADHGQILHP